MDNPSYIFKTKPGPGLIIISLLSTGGFGWVTWLLAFHKWHFVNMGPTVGYMIAFCVIGVFAFLAAFGFGLLISFKQYALTATELIISRPLIFNRKVIPLSDIWKLDSENYPMKISDNKKLFEKPADMTEVYHGKTIIIFLKNGQQLRFTSFEVSGYKELYAATSKQLNALRKQHLA